MKMVVWVSMAIHPRYVFVAVCCCLNIAISVATCDFDNKITNGFRLESFTFGYFPNWTIYGCAAQCVMHVVCASFNFDLTLKACYLNYKSAVENADGLQSHEHFLYSDISVWSKMVAGPCFDHTCSRTKRCVIKRGTATKCGKAVFTNLATNPKSSYVFRHTLNWTHASDRCEKFGSQLVVVDSVEENSFLKAKTTTAGKHNTELWTGVRYFVNVSSWLLWDGTVPTFTDWELGHPTVSSENSCTVIIFKSGWKSRDCSRQSSYICERQHK